MHYGEAKSRAQRDAQMEHNVDYPSFMTRSLSASSASGVQPWPPRHPGEAKSWPAHPVHPGGTLDRHEVIQSGDIRMRALLPASGLKSEVADMKKVSNYSAVRYNFLAEQATPIHEHDKTSFMSLAHRDHSAPGVWLPPGRRAPVDTGTLRPDEAATLKLN